MLAGPLPPLAIPTTLQDALMARLDRLSAVKEVAQLGAVLGREFAYELLWAVTPLDEATVQRALARLVEVELVYQRGLPPQARYVFKHALIRDAAYASLLRSARQQYHQRIARVLETQFPETIETQPELLAHHYTEAGLPVQAIPYWQRAGQHALERSANLEAISHLTTGLEVLQGLLDTRERARQELDLQITLALALHAIKGQSAPEVERAYARARELCTQAEDAPQLFRVLMGLYRFYGGRMQRQTAREIMEQLYSLAQRVQDPDLLLQAHMARGTMLMIIGDPVTARGHLEQAIALYDPQLHRSHAFRYSLALGVVSLSRASWTLWLLGYPDQALSRSQETLALARELAHPHSLAMALCFAAMFHQFRREAPAARELAEATVALATEQGLLQYMAAGTFLRGWALIAQGQGADGLVQLRQGVATYRATGTVLDLPWYLGVLADAYGSTGEAEAGLAALAEALATADKTDFYEAELYRLKGVLLLGQTVPDASQAETCFQQARARAHRQQAKALELRAAMSLSRLWQQQGKQDEARELLAPIYGWFTEGFDTADLQEAKALLEELS